MEKTKEQEVMARILYDLQLALEKNLQANGVTFSATADYSSTEVLVDGRRALIAAMDFENRVLNVSYPERHESDTQFEIAFVENGDDATLRKGNSGPRNVTQLSEQLVRPLMSERVG